MPPKNRERLLEDLRVPKPRNSAGRNLPAAIATGVFLGALVIGSLLVGPAAWYTVVAIAAALGTLEVSERLRESDWQVPRPVLVLGGQLIIWLTIPWGTMGLLVGLVATVLVLFVSRLFLHGTHEAPRNWLRDTAAGVFILIWIPTCIALAAMLSRMDNPWEIKPQFVILTFMLCVVANDVGGYAAGVFFGKHPMAPAVSPKKSWEGFAGSVITATAVGTACVVFLFESSWWAGAILGIALAVASTLGDLVESQVKRDLGIKDMSALLPGHGGLMDRLDGMLPAAAMTWMVITLFENLAFI